MYQGYNRPQLLGAPSVNVAGAPSVNVAGTPSVNVAGVSHGYDILGDVDVLGDEALAILGAAARRAYQRPMRGGGAASNTVAQKQATQTRRLDLAVDSGATPIAAAASLTITVTPPEPIRVEQIMVAPSIAPAFVLTAATIGRANQIMGAGSLAAELCSPNNPFAVQWDTAQTSQPILLTVTNTSGAALRFLGSLRGTVVTH